MASIQIVEVRKGTIVATGERFLEVLANITDGEQTIPRNFGFSMETTKDDIQAELGKVLELYEQEKVQAEANAERDAEDATADETITALEGLEITSDKQE